MSTTNLITTFIDTDSSLDQAGSIQLALDTTMNNDTTEFAIGSNVFVRVHNAGDNNDVFKVNTGIVTKIATNIPLVITNESVNFINTNIAYLDYIPNGVVNWAWVGISGGNPVFNGKKITLGNSINVGVLRCSYVTLFDRLMVYYNGVDEATVLLVGIRGSASSSLSVPFVAESVTGTTKDVTINIKDYCSGEIVPYANITVSGLNYPAATKIANANGRAIFENLVVGRQYDLKVTASGYRDSDLDSLDNAHFTVE